MHTALRGTEWKQRRQRNPANLRCDNEKKNLHFAHTEPRFNNGRHADLADQTDRTGEQPLPTLERVIQYPIRLLSRAVASVVHKLSK